MNDKLNVGFLADGQLFGYDAETLIAKTGKGLLLAGKLDLRGKGIGGFVVDTVPDSERELKNILAKSVIMPNVDANASFVIRDGKVHVLLLADALSIGLQKGDGWCVFTTLDKSLLKNGNRFEKFVFDFANWANIRQVTVMFKSAKDSMPDLSVMESLAGKKIPVLIPSKKHASDQLVASAVMSLNNSFFGEGLKALTGISELEFHTGGSLSDPTFTASLISSKPIKGSICNITDLVFNISSQKASFSLEAGGFLQLNINPPISFLLKGSVSMASFALTASSVKDAKLYITNKLFISELALTIGYNKGLSLGMCGRAVSSNITLFAGFNLICSPLPPRINLLTAAISSTTGRLSLKDIVVEIAEVNPKDVNFLDVVAIKDFDLVNVKLPQKITSDTPCENVENMFNGVIASEMKINKNDTQITPFSDDQFILTDKGRMRHYRIDKNGVISLNCQIFICTEPLKLGQYDIKPGFFICGVLEVFGIDVRFLLEVEKGKKLTALVQLSPIKIGTAITIAASTAKNPIEPINGGLAGQLVKPGTGGAMLYLSMTPSCVNFYLNAKIQILSIFNFEALVIVRDQCVYIDVTKELFGFTTIVRVTAAYQSFSSANFSLTVIFDSSKFTAAIEAASAWLRNQAKELDNSIKEVQGKITDAQNRVWSLQSQINDLNYKIAQCRRAISNASWWKKAFVAIAKGCEIAAYATAKAGIYVAIGVAVAALEAAKAVIGAGGKIGSAVLNSVAYILNAVTKLLWINSFELAIAVTPSELKFKASLNFTVLGSQKQIGGEINLDTGRIGDTIMGFVKDKILDATKSAFNSLKSSEYYLESGNTPEFALEYHDMDSLFANLEKNRDILRRSTELFIDVQRAHIDVYGAQYDMAFNNAAEISRQMFENESTDQHFSQIFDQEFIESLSEVKAHIPPDKSGELTEKLTSLENFAKQSLTSSNVKRDLDSANFMERLETQLRDMDGKIHKEDKEPLKSPEANKEMAGAIERAMAKHFGDMDDNDVMNPANDEDILNAITQLRFSGKRKKQKRGQPQDSEDRKD